MGRAGLRDARMTAAAIREGAEGIYVEMDVRPGARETHLGGSRASPRGAIRIDVAAPPQRGAANRQLCAYLERLLGPGVRVLVVRGLTSRRKTVFVAGTTIGRVAEAFGRGIP